MEYLSVFLYKSRFEFWSTQVSEVFINPGKEHFEGLVHLLRYIGYNKTLGLNKFSGMEDAPLYDLFGQVNINTENQIMFFSDLVDNIIHAPVLLPVSGQYCQLNQRKT